MIFFAGSNPGLLLTITSYLHFPQLLPAQGQAEFTFGSIVSISQFFLNYGGVVFSSWFTQSYGLIQSLAPFIGYLFPLLAFASLIFVRKKQARKLTLGFSLIFIIVLLFVVMVDQKSPVFIWLYNNFALISVLRGTEGVQFITSFLVVTLTALTMNEVITRIHSAKFTINWNLKKKALSVTLISLLVISFFAYVPAFLSGENVGTVRVYKHSPNNAPVALPPVYNLIVDWMEGQGPAGSFRYMLLPSPFSSSPALPNWYPYQFAPAQGSALTNQYVYYSLSALLSGQTDLWGRLLASASVKYIFVVWNTSETNMGSGASEWAVQGKPNIQSGNRPCGSYADYITLLRLTKRS